MNEVFLRVELSGPAELSEPVCAILYRHACRGCEENLSGPLFRLNAWFDESENAAISLDSVKSAFPDVSGSIYSEKQQDWMAKWRESMKPAYIGNRLWVSPQWLPPQANDIRHWIKIEPRMAFGSGHHETTRLASNLLCKNLAERSFSPRVLDIGTGSGILCLVASVFGAKSLGLEIDPGCLMNTAENRNANSELKAPMFVTGKCDSLKKSVLFDIIVMNMIINEAAPLLDRIRSMLALNASFVWSGILTLERNEAVSLAVKAGFKICMEDAEGEWWAGAFMQIEN
jgi:ribosomal protein L11 methyltransferase